MADLICATDDTGGPEIFASLQGEGPSMGMPVSFIRLSRCNLACVWCDTAYTWRFANENGEDERPHRDGVAYDRKANQFALSPAEAAERIAALGQKRLVITGGEPMLQAGALAEMLEALDALVPGMDIEIETNGTAKPPARLDIRVDQFNVSPKLAHSGNAADLSLVPKVLDFYAADPRAYFKFVIAEPEDVAEVVTLADHHGFAPGRVFLMPEGVTSQTLRSREAWLSALCLDQGFRLSDRLHIHLYGDSRGT